MALPDRYMVWVSVSEVESELKTGVRLLAHCDQPDRFESDREAGTVIE
jgi:hypothetical protein